MMSSDHSTLLCPNCKEVIPQALNKFKLAGCSACGSISAWNKNGQLELAYKAHPLDETYQKLIKVGQSIQHQKINYKIAALFVYHVDFQEWDKEDSKWIQEYGFIREWYAYSEEGKELILMQDTDKKFYWVSSPEPAHPTSPLVKRTAQEVGKYQLYGVAGIDHEDLDLKGFYRIYGHTRYECPDENFEKNILQYQLNRLSKVQVMRMLILQETEKIEAIEDFITTTYYRNVFGFALLAIVLLLIFNLGLNDKKVQTSKYVGFVESYTDGVLDTGAVKPQLAGVFDLQEGQNYQLNATCFLSQTNRYADYSLTLVREADAAVVGDAALSFYTESGHDDEGYWVENLLQDQLKFQVDKSGKYQIFVAPDYENLEQLPSAGLEIQISPAPYTFFYLCMGSVFLLLFLIFQWRRENFVAFANLPHDTILHDIFES